MQTKLSPWMSLIAFLALFTFQAAAQPSAPAAAGVPGAAPSEQLPGTIRATRVVGKVSVEEIASKVRGPLANDQIIQQGTIVRTEVGSSHDRRGRDDHQDVRAGERCRGEHRAAPGAELVETTDVDDTVASLEGLARNRNARKG